MEAVLVSRNQGGQSTTDRTLDLILAGDGKRQRQALDSLPASEWSTSSAPHAHPGAAQAAQDPQDASYKPHALGTYSKFGSDEPNELATFIQGREAWHGNAELRDDVEDDLRAFAEQSDHTEGFLLTSQHSTGFSGLTSSFLETLRDEFPKSAIWVTAILSDARGWKRPDSDRAKAQRLLNEALGLVAVEDVASMVLPVQPVQTYDAYVEGKSRDEWRRFLRDDIDSAEAYQQVLTMHLQSAGSELREPDVLTSVIEQLNWRGGTKIASLSGHTPLAPAPYYGSSGSDEARRKVRAGERDFSAWRGDEEDEAERARDRQVKEKKRDDEVPFAQYSVVRGLDFEESQEMGPLLEEAVKPLKEPLVRWVSLPDPFPILATSPPVFRGLHPHTGHPLHLPTPSTALPLLSSDAPAPSAALFGLPEARFPPALTFSAQQPRAVPVLTTLSTRPSTARYVRHLARGMRELRRVRAGVLREYDEGEFALGREGVDEARERLEALWDGYGGADEDDEREGDKDADEDWTATEQVDDEWDL
ncbi:hypothetical protein JCM3775_003027 [Rhodotorula graminis]|uniref:DML1/Misato tubulin domain-containing protein n=1 Tax=Rhodotorula graminis (strain WP1) TaxID=578459 RepID=A0A194S7S3_RHOGW|nr:uncharacterized protein RHOBADRAFT_52593 [Rhodotorula graminis WP1]KPV76609.1 hypothetical protein RHOBADRAFT_52593 [Rhodotorula graminis WP1]